MAETGAYETVEVPFRKFGNRRGLTFYQLHCDRELHEFVKRFRSSFEESVEHMAVLFIEPEA